MMPIRPIRPLQLSSLDDQIKMIRNPNSRPPSELFSDLHRHKGKSVSRRGLEAGLSCVLFPHEASQLFHSGVRTLSVLGL